MDSDISSPPPRSTPLGGNVASQDFVFVNSDGLRFVVVCGQKVSASMANLSESQTERLKARYGNQFIWFRKGQRNYVITDRSLISEVLSFFAPMRDLGQQQMPEKLQEELSPRQSSVAASKVPSISAKYKCQVERDSKVPDGPYRKEQPSFARRIGCCSN